LNEFIFDQWFNEFVDYHLIDEHVEQINKFFDHFLFDEMNLNINEFNSRVKLRIFDKTMMFWLFLYIIIAWRYSTSHINSIIRFCNQIVFLTIKICFMYSISQMNNVIVDYRFENQLITSLFTLKTYFDVDCLMFWFSAQSEFV
jgi:hypothetical protein